MKYAKSLSLVSLAFLGLAACTPKPAETEAPVAPAEATMPMPEASNGVAADMVPAVEATNAVAPEAAVNGVAPAADEPRGNPDRRTPAAVQESDAPK